jgi:hypothetical protein
VPQQEFLGNRFSAQSSSGTRERRLRTRDSPRIPPGLVERGSACELDGATRASRQDGSLVELASVAEESSTTTWPP